MRNVERIDPLAVEPLRLRDALASALEGGPVLALTQLPLTQIPESAALLIETGGSTGEPKVVALSASALQRSSSLSNQALGASGTDQWSLSLPLNHIAGINQLLRSIDLGNDPVAFDAQFISIVPTQLYRAIELAGKALDELRGAKKVLIGGAAIPEQLIEQGKDVGIQLVTSYGMTEMSGGCIYDGKALPGVEVRIEESGRISLNGPMRALCYLNNERATNQSFVGDWFVTSDHGFIDNKGLLHIAGRADDVIISGGEKISTQEVQRVVQQRYPNMEIYVIGIPDPEWGESLRLVMAHKDLASNQSRASEFSLQEIRKFVGESLAKVAAPRSLLLLSEIPTKENGKVDLAALTTASATEIY